VSVHGCGEELCAEETSDRRGLAEDGLEPVAAGVGGEVGAVGRGGRGGAVVPGGARERERGHHGAVVVVGQLVLEGVRPEGRGRRLAAEVDGRRLLLLRVAAARRAAHGRGRALLGLLGGEVERQVEVGRRQALAAVVVERRQGAVEVRVVGEGRERTQQPPLAPVAGARVLEPDLCTKTLMRTEKIDVMATICALCLPTK